MTNTPTPEQLDALVEQLNDIPNTLAPIAAQAITALRPKADDELPADGKRGWRYYETKVAQLEARAKAAEEERDELREKLANVKR